MCSRNPSTTLGESSDHGINCPSRREKRRLTIYGDNAESKGLSYDIIYRHFWQHTIMVKIQRATQQNINVTLIDEDDFLDLMNSGSHD